MSSGILSVGEWNITAANILALLWVLGSIVMFAQAIKAFRREKKYFKMILIHAQPLASSSLPSEHVKGINKVKIVVSEDIRVPCIFGLIRPIIYLPNIELSVEELNYILLHELDHYRNKDLWIKLFYNFIKIAFWWNPLVHIIQKDIDQIIEMACDTRVIDGLSLSERASYLQAMIKIMRNNSGSVYSELSSVVFFVHIERQSLINQRFLSVANRDKRNKRTHFRSVILASLLVCVFLASYIFIIQPAAEPPEEGMILLTPETAHIEIDKTGRIMLFYMEEYLFDLDNSDLTTEPHASLEVICLNDGG
ncbi:MAG: M56 family metallopeptidase [Christensenellaceae bacterium]